MRINARTLRQHYGSHLTPTKAPARKSGTSSSMARMALGTQSRDLLALKKASTSRCLGGSVGRSAMALTSHPPTSAKAASTRAEHPLASAGLLPRHYKQTGNGCGTTSTAMILTALTGKPVTQQHVDRAVRRFDVFVAPRDLVDYARERGVRADSYNNGSWDEVATLLDRDCPVQAMIQSKGQINNGVEGPHYVIITNYDTRVADGRVTYRDPNGWEKTVSRAKFDKMWNGLGFGFKRFFNAYAPRGVSLPAGRTDGVEGALRTLAGATNAMNGFHRMGSGSPIQGALQLGGGLVQGLGGAVQFGVASATKWVDNKVEKIPILGGLIGSISSALRTVGKVVGSWADGIGEGVSNIGAGFSKLLTGDVGGFFGKTAQGIGDVVAGVGKGVGKALVGAAKGVGNAVVGIGKAIGGGLKGVGNAIGSFFGW